ncbi:MAG: glycosyltransferase [Anaerolineales bacterium]|nr:glycosyltransferase [Anaerolineales bacterium]
MKIAIFAAGSRGDIQPCVALGRGLQHAGYAVVLAAPADFADFVQGHGVAFTPLRGDVQQLMASDTARRLMEGGGASPIASIRAIRRLVEPVITQMADDAYLACQKTDAIICLGVLSAFGQAIAESQQKPMLHVEPTPLLPTRAFPAPGFPIQRNLAPGPITCRAWRCLPSSGNGTALSWAPSGVSCGYLHRTSCVSIEPCGLSLC